MLESRADELSWYFAAPGSRTSATRTGCASRAVGKSDGRGMIVLAPEKRTGVVAPLVRLPRATTIATEIPRIVRTTRMVPSAIPRLARREATAGVTVADPARWPARRSDRCARSRREHPRYE